MSRCVTWIQKELILSTQQNDAFVNAQNCMEILKEIPYPCQMNKNYWEIWTFI